jgi:LPXTG-site transpeptidase (sortase) family protein
VSPGSSAESKETIIPLSLVVTSVGVIILLTTAIIWLAAPLQIPQRLQLAATPIWQLTLTPAPSQAPNPALVLLPETPLVDARRVALPSVAALDEAPRWYDDSLPGQPVRLVIPRLELDAPVQRVDLEQSEYEGQLVSQWLVPFGHVVGWHSDSALLGQVGNTVLNGHHNVYGQVFRDLIQLESGDEVIVYDQERPFYYYVSEQLLLPERGEPLATRLANAAWIGAMADERLTLVTCWPFTDNSHRLVVVARPAAP